MEAIIAVVAVMVGTIMVYITDCISRRFRESEVVGGVDGVPHYLRHAKVADYTINSEFLYHGSMADIAVDDYIYPRPSYVVDNNQVVYGTQSMSVALMFLGNWNFSSIQFGYEGDRWFAIELYAGAFDHLRAKGYIYKIESKTFHGDPRLGLQGYEFVSAVPAKVISREYITDAFAKMQELGEIRFTTNEELMKLALSPPITNLPQVAESS